MSTRTHLAITRHGLGLNVPRSLKQAALRRVRALEDDARAFDRAAVEHRAKLKKLYAVLHLAPSPRAQATLFSRRPPVGSPLAALSRLAELGRSDSRASLREVAALVREHRLPYLLVESALGGMPEEVAIAIVESAPLDELLSRLVLMARRGLVHGKLERALAARLSALAPSDALTYRKIEAVVRRGELGQDIAARLFALLPVEELGPLSGTTALLVDASASMDRGHLELAARVAMLTDRMLVEDAELRAVCFGGSAERVQCARASDLGAWRQRLAIGANDLAPGTSVGAAVSAAGDHVSRFVIVTDGAESRPPRLVSTLLARRARVGRDAELVLVLPHDGSRQLAVDLKTAQIPCEVFTLDRHGVGLPALARVLAARGSLDRVAAIRAYPL